MATFESFEELQAWQRARDLAAEVYSLSKNGSFARDGGFRHQI